MDLLGAAEVVEGLQRARRPRGAAGSGRVPCGRRRLSARHSGLRGRRAGGRRGRSRRGRRAAPPGGRSPRRARARASSGTAVCAGSSGNASALGERRAQPAPPPQPDPDREGQRRSRPARAARSSRPGATSTYAETRDAADARPACRAPSPRPASARKPRVELLGGRDRHDHQRADQQQADGAHRDGDGDRGQHRRPAGCRARTCSPATRANSSSWATANSCGRRPSATTTHDRGQHRRSTTTSLGGDRGDRAEEVACSGVAALCPARPVISTPPAMPP